MSQHPIILIPQAIKDAQLSLPPIDIIFTETKPQKPGIAPKKVNYTLTVIATIFAVIIAFIVSQSISIPSWLTLLIAMGAITGNVWYQFTSYPKRLQKHHQEVANYPIKLKEYEDKKHFYEDDVKKLRSPEKVKEYRFKEVLTVLSQTIPHDGNNLQPPIEGQNEKFFKEYLNQHFSQNIYKNLQLIIPNYEYPYTPDFAYIDQGLKLYIDIELDEPYVYHTGAPTHYLGAWKDNKRNNFFNKKGWVVVRFSEEQVICYPHSCCKTIAQVIAQIIGDTSTLNQFDNISDLEQQRQWTEQEAVEMAANKKRDNYLCQNNISNSNPVILMTSLIKTKQQVSQPLPPNNITLTRTQSRGAARARHRALNLSISPPTKNTTLSSLVSCPYCSAKVKTTKLELHKTNKCPKRPLL
ncbi:MAG: DUF559 domain-containing protein [Nostoc sp. NMS7]|uniref:DUF559 domain-containing protein n=1 Tax=Nostoc sp. NMS7 TaxID=2815391 RepID=UPI0025D2E190|nr:DUF559 domain-containing protein [Nostoc sp. NMS7]MBN3950119.1 DUF559 domain-containing protein [Nostoc sp. NMS7]